MGLALFVDRHAVSEYVDLRASLGNLPDDILSLIDVMVLKAVKVDDWILGKLVNGIVIDVNIQSLSYRREHHGYVVSTVSDRKTLVFADSSVGSVNALQREDRIGALVISLFVTCRGSSSFRFGLVIREKLRSILLDQDRIASELTETVKHEVVITVIESFVDLGDLF